MKQIIALCLIAGLLTIYACDSEPVGQISDKVSHQMDERELWYDADDWFVLIDCEDGVLGVYNGNTPIEKAPCFINTYKYDLGHGCEVSTTWAEVQDSIAYEYLESILPDNTPVYIY